jgi:hypothetical protein
VYFDDIPSVSDAVEFLESRNVLKNRSATGTVFQDGTVVFTNEGISPTGNYFTVDCALGGLKVEFKGEDFLAVRAKGKKIEHISGKAKKLLVEKE